MFEASSLTQSRIRFAYSSGFHWSGYFTTELGNIGYSDSYDYYLATTLKFTSPNFTGLVTTIEVNLCCAAASYIKTDHYYALCTSDENKSLYENKNEPVTDPYQIASGTFNKSSFAIDAFGLEPNKTYYLFMFGGSSSFTLDTAPNHSIFFSYPQNVALIDDGESFGLYACLIDNGTSWAFYTPYISVENIYSWDGIFKATVNATDGGLYLRSGTGTSYTNLVLMPYGEELDIEDITIGDDGSTILAKASYSSKTGWANTKYLDFIIYGETNSESGTPLYTNAGIDSECLSNLSSDVKLDITELTVADRLIWGYASVKDAYGSSMSGFVKIQDITMLSERRVLEWVPCSYRA